MGSGKTRTTGPQSTVAPVARFGSVPDESRKRPSAHKGETETQTPERNGPMSARSIFYAWMNGDLSASEANQMFAELGSSTRIAEPE